LPPTALYTLYSEWHPE